SLDKEAARIKAVDYMEANGRIAKFVTAYEYIECS
ncbi:MAG: hypothetical protein UY18_C0050G0001, partial [Microgenomates group bacterium GW2011_GWF2_47_9]